MTSPHTGEDSIHTPRPCHHQVSSVTVSKQFSPGTSGVPRICRSEERKELDQHSLQIWYRVPVTAHRSPSQVCSSSETLPTTTWQSRAWSRGVYGSCGRLPGSMTASVVPTARRTSLTAIMYYRSCGTLPLSTLQATRLTCSSHRNTVSPAPKRPQTRSLYTR
jgi:hypothetical protein